MFDKDRKRRATYKEVFSTEAGREVLEDLMKNNFIWNSTITSDLQETSYNEGRRSVVLAILNYVSLDADRIQTMMKQNYERSIDDNF
jgi:hypothetical protein|tara:strand:- start:1725 stop:1985 length:261 start_codon:yes stop_codon:yes gene_type:complete